MATPTYRLVLFLVVAEVSAKLAMVAGAASGRPGSDGLGAVFIQSLKSRRVATMMVAIVTSLTIVILALGLEGLLGVCSALLVGGILAALSGRVFQCVTGDVLGATNELSRSISLLVLVVSPWV
jgi:adenosylcobinamide-GDP ribazoletransferase